MLLINNPGHASLRRYYPYQVERVSSQPCFSAKAPRASGGKISVIEIIRNNFWRVKILSKEPVKLGEDYNEYLCSTLLENHSTTMTKFEQAIKLFDTYNRNSPETVFRDEDTYPAEYFYALKLHEWVLKLTPDAGEALLLASRCQHIGRWEIQRGVYPEGRIGYLKWRSDLSKFHADTASSLLRSISYDEETIEKVREIVLKKHLRTETDVQTMEDALCLVFLEFQFDDLIAKQPEDKMIVILQKTWAKMSQQGKEQALKLRYSPDGAKLINQALS